MLRPDANDQQKAHQQIIGASTLPNHRPTVTRFPCQVCKRWTPHSNGVCVWHPKEEDVFNQKQED